MEKESLYQVGAKAQAGDQIALMKIINIKKNLIKKYSFGNEDYYQEIIEKLIKGINNFKFLYYDK